jgi:hypothetical protein
MVESPGPTIRGMRLEQLVERLRLGLPRRPPHRAAADGWDVVDPHRLDTPPGMHAPVAALLRSAATGVLDLLHRAGAAPTD